MNLARTILAASALGLAALAANAAPVTYTVDTTHSRVTFYVNHLGFSNSVGEFRLGEGTLTFDADDWSRSKVDAHIPVQSLELGDAKWNTHILSADFLESAKYPEITFVSKKLEKVDATHGRLHGDLTIHGVTKPVVLDVTVNKVGEHPMRKTQAAGFTATATIKRSEFGVVAYVPAVADDVVIRIEIESFVPKA
ncbi:MAG: YceI family protein [Proteobacteria bacterium]|nr:YceI family protein [Pseudomonadota bacterium]